MSLLISTIVWVEIAIDGMQNRFSSKQTLRTTIRIGKIFKKRNADRTPLHARDTLSDGLIF